MGRLMVWKSALTVIFSIGFLLVGAYFLFPDTKSTRIDLLDENIAQVNLRLLELEIKHFVLNYQPETFAAVVTVWYPKEIQQQITYDSSHCNGAFRGRSPTLADLGDDIYGNITYAEICSSTIICPDLFAQYGLPLNQAEPQDWPKKVLRHHCVTELPIQ
jgi:hypothetical protein